MGLLDIFKSQKPKQDYATLDPNIQGILDQSTPQDPMLMAQNQRQQIEPIANEFTTGESGLSGVSPSVFSQAMKDRQSQLVANDMNKLKRNLELSNFNRVGARYGQTFNQAMAKSNFEQGVSARQQQYQMDRNAMKRQVINSVLGGVGTIAGGIIGSSAGPQGTLMGAQMGNQAGSKAAGDSSTSVSGGFNADNQQRLQSNR